MRAKKATNDNAHQSFFIVAFLQRNFSNNLYVNDRNDLFSYYLNIESLKVIKYAVNTPS